MRRRAVLGPETLDFHNSLYFHEASAGGHFAAWEQPQVFSEELQAGFKSLRS